MQRFPSAEAADLVNEGAAAFHRQLIKSDLAVEYGNEIRVWLEELRELEELDAERAQAEGKGESAEESRGETEGAGS